MIEFAAAAMLLSLVVCFMSSRLMRISAKQRYLKFLVESDEPMAKVESMWPECGCCSGTGLVIENHATMYCRKMVQYNNGQDIEVSYAVGQAEVQSATSWEEMMRFIINHRPMVVHQFWIDTRKSTPDVYRMLYNLVKPAPEEVVPSDI